MRGFIQLLSAVLLLSIILTVINYSSIPTSTTSSLYNTIKEKQNDYYIPPEDARIDKVWKKTPGLNGKKVNVDESYQNMKKDGKFIENKLIYEPVSPKTSIDDLPPSPIYRGHDQKDMVSFLINVSWGEEYIPDILKILSDHDVKANFFIDGAFAQRHKQLVTMIAEDDHIIGSHGYNHPDFSKMDAASTEENLQRTNNILKAFTDNEIEWFAPPSGSFSNITVTTADKLNLETILWSVDTIDWRKPTKEVLIHRVTTKVHNGATILMHPTEVTLLSLEDLITQLKEDYKIVDFPQLISEKR
ncbi:polysaccharide deacetylase family protein [Halobacillus sp. B23F22_1]|uniref:polysaccharide deacetylase family protein n=1 Tax=Halobacillus sp. B23F22_1 TaxID=3459514 RepID=UPI00373E2558